MAGIDVEGDAAADIGGGSGAAGFAPDERAGVGVAKFDAVGVLGILVDGEDLEAGSGGVEERGVPSALMHMAP